MDQLKRVEDLEKEVLLIRRDYNTSQSDIKAMKKDIVDLKESRIKSDVTMEYISKTVTEINVKLSESADKTNNLVTKLALNDQTTQQNKGVLDQFTFKNCAAIILTVLSIVSILVGAYKSL